eukprot:5374730-Prorocentrum_lima.AAC.1
MVLTPCLPALRITASPELRGWLGSLWGKCKACLEVSAYAPYFLIFWPLVSLGQIAAPCSKAPVTKTL